MAGRVIGLDVLRSVGVVDERRGRSVEMGEVSPETAKALGVTPNAVARVYEILNAALDVFDRLGPKAGLTAVANETGMGRRTVARLFPNDDSLRIAYRYWSFISMIEDELWDAAEQSMLLLEDATSPVDITPGSIDGQSWMDGVREFSDCFEHYRRDYCQFTQYTDIDEELRLRAVDPIKAWLKSVQSLGIFDIPDLEAAAIAFVAVLSESSNQLSWSSEMLAAANEPMSEDEAIAVQLARRQATAVRREEAFAAELHSMRPILRVRTGTNETTSVDT